MFNTDGGAPDAHALVAEPGCVADDAGARDSTETRRECVGAAVKKFSPLTARWFEKRVESMDFHMDCSQESSTPHGAAFTDDSAVKTELATVGYWVSKESLTAVCACVFEGWKVPCVAITEAIKTRHCHM